MKDNDSIFKKEDKVRTHIIIPRYLHEKVKQSAANNDRRYSNQITAILRGVYGNETK